MNTKQVIASMLKENTGKHMLDSGFENGRHWQQNQIREFEQEPGATVEFSRWGEDNKEWEALYITNVYHFLVERLEYSQEIDDLFHNVFVPAYEEENGDSYWLELMSAFFGWLEEERPSWIEDHTDAYTVNTYNGEDTLSQVLQYVACRSDDHGEIVGLQIHGGADVRGGYTKPRFFVPNGHYSDEYPIADNAHGSLQCSNEDCECRWDTDDSYHWYKDGMSNSQLNDQEVIVIDDKAICPECLGGWITPGYDSNLEALPELPTLPIED